MQKGIETILKRSPGSKAKDIAKELELDKTAVNSFLYSMPAEYAVDKEFKWTRTKDLKFVITTKTATWLAGDHVEKALKKYGSPLENPSKYLNIEIDKDRRLLLSAIAKILALANQAVQIGKVVSLEIGSTETLSYLNRAHFFERLHPDVSVTPHRPESVDEKFNGQNYKIVELQRIGVPGVNVPKMIRNSLEQSAPDQQINITSVQCAISELVNNVEEHSQTPYPGFAGLQVYQGGPRPAVMMVVSDNGLGICGTLLPVLGSKYPDLAKKLSANDPLTGPNLIFKAFTEGGFSQVMDDDSRGTGLRTSGRSAANLRADVIIRQEKFEIEMQFRDGEIRQPKVKLDLPKLLGTHVTFKFYLTNTKHSA
ncbi:hypothetical protein [Pseudomonas sp.]|uniref:hypothetical protein n=1 Tax=Pseudomonas sp. TaxID=306 RepID=UPI0028B14958|nr:hypothetical protein [Pseudomonas sp.]